MASTLINSSTIGEFIANAIISVSLPFVEKITKDKISDNIVFSKNREKKDAMKKSYKVYDINHITDNLFDEINRISRGKFFTESSYVNMAIQTNKLISYAMCYLTTDIPLITATRTDKEFINSISDLAGYGKIYKDNKIANIEKYNAAKVHKNYKGKYLLDYEYLLKVLFNEEFQEKCKAKAARMSILDTSVPKLEGTVVGESGIGNSPAVVGFNARIDKEGLIHPIFFDDNYSKNSPNFIKHGFGISDKVFNKFENTIGSIINNIGDKYRYIVDNNGNYNVIVSRSNAMGAEDSYIIDDGTIMGGSHSYVLATFINHLGERDNLFVDVDRHPEIAAKILANNFYLLNQDNVVEIILSDYFENGSIYRFIDFSNTPWLDIYYNTEKIKLLEKNLTACIKVSEGERFRFASFDSPSKFKLVSDRMIKSTLAFMGATSSKIIEGETISVDGTNLTRQIGDSINSFVIEYKNE